MSTVPEVVLAREAGLCYAAIAMSTDYDSWREGDHVDYQHVLQTFKNNVEKVITLFRATVSAIAYHECTCQKPIN